MTTGGTVTSNGYALDVGGSVALDGVSGVTLAADNLNLRYNRLDRAVENMVIATGGDDYVLNLLDNETRLSGAINADIAGMIGLSGQMFIESRTGANARTVTLSDGSTVEVEQLILGGAGLSANVGPAGIGAELTGRISGIQRFGAFVKLDETGADGLVPVRSIGREFFHFDAEAATEFYQHDQHWSNRMILGDGLKVMASLAEREGLKGQVQCIYIDPPYNTGNEGWIYNDKVNSPEINRWLGQTVGKIGLVLRCCHVVKR